MLACIIYFDNTFLLKSHNSILRQVPSSLGFQLKLSLLSLNGKFAKQFQKGRGASGKIFDFRVLGQVAVGAGLLVEGVNEVAAKTKFAECFLTVSKTLFGLVPAVGGIVLAEFVVAVGKLALAAVGAVALLSELPAQFQLLISTGGLLLEG